MSLADVRQVVGASAGSLVSAWRPLLTIALIYRLVAFAVLTPLAGLLLRGLLWADGTPAIADQEIVGYLLSPLGIVSLILVGGAGLAILALGQACLMTVALAAGGEPVAAVAALRFVARRTPAIGRVAVRLVARVLVLVAPFAGAIALLYWLLLSGHDINYYLAERPPEFLLGAGLAGALGLVLAVLLVRRLLAWAFALPLLLFENVAAPAALAVSTARYSGNSRLTATVFALWAVAVSILGGVPLLVVLTIAQWVVPWSRESMPTLVVVMGALLTLWSTLGLLLAILADAALAALVLQLYRFGGGKPSIALPGGRPLLGGLTLSAGRLVAAAVVAAGAAALVGFLFMDGLRAEDEALIVAHRGASLAAPENTLAAFELAIQGGADYVEFDVQESRDGRVVVAHDADLMRVGGVPLRVWATDAEQLRQVDIGSFHSPEFAGERVPLLEEVLELGRDRVRLLIELKYYGHDDRLEERVVEIVERLGMQDQISVMSLEPAMVARMKQLRPDWKVGLLTAVAVGNLTRMPADFLAVSARMATASFIDRAHAAGKPVWVWTVNDPINMSRLLSRGVDGLITDLPGRGREVLAARADLNTAERLLLAAAFWVGLDPPVEPAVAVDVPAGSIAE